MVAWPLYAVHVQHINKAALVEVMKMGIGVERRDEDITKAAYKIKGDWIKIPI